jgi:dTDP-4-dehydrorhamnose 3,5-epimerase-like enzyme
MIEPQEKPHIIIGGQSIDNRGALGFVNDMSLEEFERFYVIQNHENGFIRAWHGHKIEKKAFFVVQGSVQVSCVAISDFQNPSKETAVESYILDSRLPRILIVPAGYANGLKNLSADAILMVFSNLTLKESEADDFRFPFDYWDPWQVMPR